MKKEAGFSAVELLMVIVVIALLAGLGFMFYRRQHKTVTTTKATVSKTQVTAPTGTAASVDSLTAQDAASESSIDQKHTGSENTTAQSSNAAAAGVGGAYNESSL